MPPLRVLVVSGSLAAALLMAAPARADAIDGHWCRGKDEYMSISGPDIVTPSGIHMQGVYGRHSFSYVAPTADPRAGDTIQMVLADENTIHVAVDATGEKPPQVWHRCQAPVS